MSLLTSLLTGLGLLFTGMRFIAANLTPPVWRGSSPASSPRAPPLSHW